MSYPIPNLEDDNMWKTLRGTHGNSPDTHTLSVLFHLFHSLFLQSLTCPESKAYVWGIFILTCFMAPLMHCSCEQSCVSLRGMERLVEKIGRLRESCIFLIMMTHWFRSMSQSQWQGEAFDTLRTFFGSCLLQLSSCCLWL